MMPPEIIKISPDDPGPALLRAAGVLKSGGLVVYPTESFYALGADALSPAAVGKVFAAKGRALIKPLPVIMHDKTEISRYVRDMSRTAGLAVRLLMPGPITLVFWAAAGVPEGLTAGTGKVGIRVPSDTIAGELARLFGGPITATSANISGEAPLADPGEVARSLGDGVDLILDGGRTPGGPPSTILDVTSDPPVLLREGRVKISRIERLLGVSSPKAGS